MPRIGRLDFRSWRPCWCHCYFLSVCPTIFCEPIPVAAHGFTSAWPCCLWWPVWQLPGSPRGLPFTTSLSPADVVNGWVLPLEIMGRFAPDQLRCAARHHPLRRQFAPVHFTLRPTQP